MKTRDISASLTIKAPAEAVFSALTTGIALWWSDQYLENKNAEDVVLEPKIGGRLYERWSNGENYDEGALIGIVTAIKRPSLLRLQGSFGMSTRIIQGTVSLKLIRQEAETLVTLSHQAVGDWSDEEESSYNANWQDLLERLKSFVETHRAEGLRYDPASDA